MADPIDPRMLPATTQQAGSMLPQPGQQVSNVLGPASPVQGIGDLEAATTAATRAGTSGFQEAEANRAALAQRLQQLYSQRQNFPQSQLSYNPTMQPITGQGFGRDIGNLFGNIGKGLLTAAAATVPGQAIQAEKYGAGRRQYGELGTEIAGIQKRLGTETETEQAAGGLAGRSMMAGARTYGAAAQMSKADAEQFRVHHVEMARMELQRESNRIREELGQGRITQEQARTQMMGKIAELNNTTKTNVAGMITDASLQNEATKATEEDFKTMSDHFMQNIFGFAPQKPVTPAIGTPRKTAQPQGGGRNVPAGAIVYDPKGKPHSADGTAPLPPGWSMQRKTAK